MARILVAEDEPHIFRVVDFKLSAYGREFIDARVKLIVLILD